MLRIDGKSSHAHFQPLFHGDPANAAAPFATSLFATRPESLDSEVNLIAAPHKALRNICCAACALPNVKSFCARGDTAERNVPAPGGRHIMALKSIHRAVLAEFRQKALHSGGKVPDRQSAEVQFMRKKICVSCTSADSLPNCCKPSGRTAGKPLALLRSWAVRR